MNASETKSVNNRSVTAQAWVRALELTVPIARNRNRVMPALVNEAASRWGSAPALLSDRERLSYAELAARQNQYARWGLERGIGKGDVVCLLMPNRPEYVPVWLGISAIGGVTALLNTNLQGSSLAHCINVVRPKAIIASAELVDQLRTALPEIAGSPILWCHGAECDLFERIDLSVDSQRGEALASGVRPVTIEDQALYIFTSGTTGMPKAARVNHARILQWSHWFAGMLNAQPSDRTYNCLPMYHSIGGVLVPGACAVSGGSVVIRDKFSAGRFWGDIRRWDCTMFQYIGELCRYLLHSSNGEDAAGHHLRLACGNGMAPEVWEAFKERFKIPHILEFYASTEGGVSLFNVEEKRGSVGRIPLYLAHRFSPLLVRIDYDTGEPLRNDGGLCIECAVDEPGEALGRSVDDPTTIGTKFEGYSNEQESEKKKLRDVVRPGDAWVRTGDLMRKDRQGFYYFLDRLGDTFRWKGENVATSEVAETICAYPGVKHANVYGVAVPATEGRAGMATLVTEEAMDLSLLRRHLANSLPGYARPRFLRLRGQLELTGTFKYSKSDLMRQGYDPSVITDPMYFDSLEHDRYVPLDCALYNRIQSGQVRL
ncbi:MAG: long-chain-acyl-CoA synthetase [Acidobacteriaceae bacterium]